MTVVIQLVAAFLVAATVLAYPTPEDSFSSSAIDSDEPFAIASASILDNRNGRYGEYY